MIHRGLKILYEDNHLLVVNKPAGLPTMGVSADRPSLLAEAKKYIKQKYDKPGNVYLGIVSRLDAPVTGIIVIARTSKAAARLTDQYRRGAIEKSYLAIVEKPPNPPAARCIDWVRKDERHRKMHISSPQAPEAKEARLTYRTLKRLAQVALLQITLETGRKHQIRLQLSHRGFSIVGDRKYGSRVEFPEGIALHSHQIKFIHPVKKTELHFTAPIPSSWHGLGVIDHDGAEFN